ncbi:MAG: YncE family protein, partial [Candidatus Hydrogenedentes bacterium]|nr:YncE family protein [Candidatus Hydrogenedentota bacterium]
MRLLLIVFSMFPLVAIADSIAEIVDNAPDLFLEQAVVGPQGDGTYVVATQQLIDPAGDTVIFPGRPLDLALSPDGAKLAVKNKNNLVFFDLSSQTILQTLPMASEGTSYHGIHWSDDGAGVWVTDSQKTLWFAERREDGQFDWKKDGDTHVGAYVLPAYDGKESVPGGFVVSPEDGVIYVCISRNNSIGIVDIASKAVLEEIPVGIAPYAIVRQGQSAYVTNWGGRRPQEDDMTGPTSGSRVVIDATTGVASTGTVSVIDLSARQVVSEIDVDLHPTEMAFSPDGKRLYVANANSDTISVINTLKNKRVDTISTRPMADMPFGSAPNALAVSPDGKLLYVANGGNNCIAVINLRKKKVAGLIPTGWYPGSVKLTEDGKLLIVANTKGVGGREH